MLAVAALVAIFCYFWIQGKAKSKNGPPLPPGPWPLPIVGNLPFLNSDILHTQFQALTQKHGPLMKIHLGSKLAIVVSSPEMAREVLKTHDITFANHDLPEGLVKKMKVHVKKLDLLFDRVMESHVKMVGKKSEDEEDFLQYLIRVKDDDEKAPLSLTHVKSLLMDMVLGGVDTSVNASEFAMAEIVSRPEVFKKIRQELDQVVGKDSIVEESHLPKLPYLQAVMKETLRLHPTLPLLVPHRNSETSVVAGYTVPKDSKIFINVWAIHRDPKHWDEPNEFKPERFLENSLDFNGGDFKYLPFGSGRRICANYC
ncbi:hypothetical protein F2Q70_00034862 [Brassica cretica]|uniref:Cytochrome P450 n=1 Tax=Brassica cretica TaxID=69181 RepID=A0A8S9JRB4_BRACR|nr:hypothetical protein F2Q70_00034862 [Brassica cretica]